MATEAGGIELSPLSAEKPHETERALEFNSKDDESAACTLRFEGEDLVICGGAMLPAAAVAAIEQVVRLAAENSRPVRLAPALHGECN